MGQEGRVNPTVFQKCNLNSIYSDSRYAFDPTNPDFKKNKYKKFYHEKNSKKKIKYN